MQVRLLPAVVMELPALRGCTSPGGERRAMPASMVQGLWRLVGDLPALRTVLPSSLRFEKIRDAQSLHEAPIQSAVLAVGTEPEAYRVGEVAVVSPRGEWRVVDRSSLGMRNPDIVEHAATVSLAMQLVSGSLR